MLSTSLRPPQAMIVFAKHLSLFPTTHVPCGLLSPAQLQLTNMIRFWWNGCGRGSRPDDIKRGGERMTLQVASCHRPSQESVIVFNTYHLKVVKLLIKSSQIIFI